jgi:hypothetical protein
LHHPPSDLRLILFHKQAISARLRFLRFTHSLYAFEPLPTSAELTKNSTILVHHPTFYLPFAESYLKLPQGSLRYEPHFRATVYTPTGNIAVYLAEFVTLDPPFAAAAVVGGKFMAITEAKSCSLLELELLRRAYAVALN